MLWFSPIRSFFVFGELQHRAINKPEFSMKQYAEPTSKEYLLSHPGGTGAKRLELAVFRDHRFAFYYWLKWARLAGYPDESPSGWRPPALVTIDWHRDLAPPSEAYRPSLDRIAEAGPEEAWRFAEEELDSHNDEQVLSAAWLNLVGNILLLKNYGMEQRDTFADRYGREHRILEFVNWGEFCDAASGLSDERVYLDIDLDYFVKNKVAPHQTEGVRLYDDAEIREIADPHNRLFRHLSERLAGFTIATEPRYCGGMQNSKYLLEVVLNSLFTPDMRWRHLV